MDIGWLAVWLATGSVTGLLAWGATGRGHAAWSDAALGLGGAVVAALVVAAFGEGRNGQLGLAAATIGGIAPVLFRNLVVFRRSA